MLLPPLRPFLTADELPRINFDLVHVPDYFQYLYGCSRLVYIYLSKGCPASCSFCFNIACHRSTRRRRNLENAFAATASFEGMRVLLVDDVLTTGSTLNSCARALREAGAADVQAVTLAGSRHYRHHQYKIYRRKP